MLSALEKLCVDYPIQLVNIHPVDVEDWSVFNDYKLPLCIENMDRDKDDAQSVEELQKLFEYVNAGMVFDVNHCYSIDPSMTLAHDMLSTFEGHIREIHVSGFLRVHGPLYKAHQPVILETIKNLHYPIIIESFGSEATADEYQKEFEYIVNFLIP